MTKHFLAGIATLALSTGCSLILDPQLPDVTNLSKFGETCSLDSQCESNMCDQRCTQACSGANPCPGTATCGASSVCIFEQLAQFGETCLVDSDCASNMCDRRCTQSCNGNTPCPSGSACVSNACEFDGPPPLTGTIKAGYLYVGPVGDHGWTLTHEEGRMYAAANLTNFESHFAPSVSSADAPQKIQDFINGGDNVIIATSFDFLVPMLSAAQNNPDVNFLLCSGFMTGPNLGSYFAHMEQPIYQAGYLAGLKTRTNKVGAIGPVVIPETVRHINAFTRGVRDANPSAKVLVRWVFAWFDPPNEEAATHDLVNAGADIIFGQTDTTIPVEVSKTLTTTNTGNMATDGLPVYSIGYDNKDSCERFAPDRCLASAYWQWGPMVTKILQEMRDGTWKPRVPVFDQMKSDPAQSTVYLSINTSIVSTNEAVAVEGLIDDLTASTPEAKYYPFRPPLRDNSGTIRVAPGSLPDDEDLITMCWFAEGVYDLDGTTPAEVPAQCIGVR